MAPAIWHAFILSFGLIIPLGVQNTFVLTQGALHRRWAGALPAVLTAALCDTLLITLAVSGVSLVVLTVPWFKTAMSWVGVLFLGYMGWVTWRTAVVNEQASDEEWPVKRQVLFAASVSLLNPHAIIDTIAVIGTNSLAYSEWERLGYTVTCIAVSWLWFLALASVGHLVGVAGAGLSIRRWLNRASALIMGAVALGFLRSLLSL